MSDTLESGWVAQGPKVTEFEKKVAEHEDVREGKLHCRAARSLMERDHFRDLNRGYEDRQVRRAVNHIPGGPCCLAERYMPFRNRNGILGNTWLSEYRTE